MSNVKDVTVRLRNVNGTLLNERVTIHFYNQRVMSLNQKFEQKLNGTPLVLKDIPSSPEGLARIVITPTNYRSKAIFKNISEDDKTIDEMFFVDPKKAKPKLMDFADLASKSYGSQLIQILADSDIDADFWNNLDKHNRATILNLSAKMLDLERKNQLSIFQYIEKIEPERLTQKHRARIFARVKQELFDEINNSPQVFGLAPGLAHSFFGAWRSFPNNSFKTRENAGNIQFTFAKNNDGLFLADIDLDDHSGIEHVIDVIKHALSRNDTDPYDIHQILKHFQNIDAEYLLL